MSRKIVDTHCRYGDASSFNRLGPGGYAADTSRNATEGRERLTQRPSEELAWRPSRKTLDEPGKQHIEKREGKKLVEPQIANVPRRAEKVHIRPHASKEELLDAPQGIARVYSPRSGIERRNLPAFEYPLEDVMTRKRRVNSLADQRNGMPCYTPGDKHYRHPEYQPAFFKEGGLVVGCTFQRGSHARTVARNTTGWKEFDAERPDAVKRKTYKQVIAEQKLAEQVASVEELTRFISITKDWDFTVTKKDGEPLGLGLEVHRGVNYLKVTKLKDGTIKDLMETMPKEKQLIVGNEIVQVNDVKGTGTQLLAALKAASTLELTVRAPTDQGPKGLSWEERALKECEESKFDMLDFADEEI
jgi:hypothetical protein